VSIYLSGWQCGLNRKVVAVTVLVLMSLAVALTPFASVLGQNSLGVRILQVIPASEVNIYRPGMAQYNGTVGTLMNLQGTIYLSNGTYNIIVGNDIVASGTAQGYYVNANFTVPQLPGGGYNLVLEDIKENDLNSTGLTPETFTILTAYTAASVSPYIQEGDSVTLNVAVTGYTAGKYCVANVTVVLPKPLNANYSTIVPLGTTSSLGTASSQVTFPGSSFQPDQASSSVANPTEYAGSYTVYFNQSEDLSSSAFSVGFLDSTAYHRGQTATVNAIGYASGQTATLTVSGPSASATLVPSQSLTASSNGTITTTFVIPSVASVGKYNTTITTTSGTPKAVQDLETFSVPGYPITVTTVNLAGEVVPDILVQAQDLSANKSYNSTSEFDGIAILTLETGPVSLTAFWKGVNVGQIDINVTGAENVKLVCQLTDLVIAVQNENGTALPFVNLDITYKYGSSQTGNASGQTDPSGTYTLNSTFVGISYTIQASMYNQVFNSGNETVSSLPTQAVSQVVIICPTEQLTINVVGYTNAPISGASLELVELTNGLFYTATTDSSGSAIAPVTFGMYRLQIYQNTILLNETTVEAFSDSQYQVRCTLYGIQVTVSVVDYFSQPISNANVTINGPSSERLSEITRGDGTTTFNNVVGGNLQIVAFAPGAESNYQAVALTVDRPTSVQIKMDGYIVFGPFLVQTSALLTIIIILVAIILLVAVEVYRRRRHRAVGT
jgi:hypothetical protein